MLIPNLGVTHGLILMVHSVLEVCSAAPSWVTDGHGALMLQSEVLAADVMGVPGKS